MKSTKIIGITGLYAAGKNYAAGFFEKKGFPVLDVDKLGYKIIEEEKERIISRFGRDILGGDGKIDRKLLGRKTFGKKEELNDLEDIVHPGANRETLAWIDSREERACVINAALLHRSSAVERLDAVIVVEAPFLVRLLRAKKRDKLPWAVLLKRFGSQEKIDYHFYAEKTDIYRVGNSFTPINLLRANSGEKKLESRINEILSLLGIT